MSCSVRSECGVLSLGLQQLIHKKKGNTTNELVAVYLQSWTVVSVQSEFSLDSMVFGYY